MKLRIHHPKIREFTIPLEARGFVVGREGGRADLELNWDERVSRRHVRFWAEDGTFWFEDLGSRNGTWLGRRRLSGAYPLIEGVAILIGETAFTLVGEDEPEVSSHATADFEPALVLGPVPVIDSVVEPAPDRSAHPNHAPATEAALAAAKPGDTVEIVVLPPDLDDVLSVSDLVADLAVAFGSPVVAPTPVAEPRSIAPSTPAPEPPLALAKASFVEDDRVLLTVTSRTELAAVWTSTLSKGALFVPGDVPPELGRKVHVLVDTPDGALEIAAEVVHVVPPEHATPGMPAGAGLQLTLPGHTRAALQGYVDGRTPGLTLADGEGASAEAHGPARPKADVDRGLARVRALIADFEAHDLYAGLELPPTASKDAIVARIEELRTLFSELQHMATPPQLARIASAAKLLDRAELVMTDPERRLEHDFRRGEVRIEERLEAARHARGPSVAQLREAWNRALPDRHEKALVLMREVVAAKKKNDHVQAIRLARAALELDPFHEELRKAVEAWQRGPSLMTAAQATSSRAHSAKE